MLVAQSCPTLCNPMDCNPPGSCVHEIFQARILGWVAISFSRGSLYYCCYSVVKSCLILCNPMNCSLPGSSVHGDFPGKNTRVDCHFLLQRIFLDQGSKLCLLRWQVSTIRLPSVVKNYTYIWASLEARMVKNLSAMWETWV